MQQGCEDLPGAIVVGADHRALGIARSLGRNGIPVAILPWDDDRIALKSRYATHRFPNRLPSSDRTLVATLMSMAERDAFEGWVLFATDDESSGLLARNREQLSTRFKVTVPDWEVLKRIHDKRTMNCVARACGVEVPFTVSPRDRQELQQLELVFPVILKPSVKCTTNPLTVARAWRADDRSTLLALYDRACTFQSPETIMVQELLSGGGSARFSFAALCRNGEVVGSLVAQRVRQYPIDFGRHSTYVETLEDAEVEDAGRRILAKIRYSGLVELEFQRDPRRGGLKLLDANHRVWGWHSIGAAAGVDFPYLEWRVHTRGNVAPVRGAPGVRWRRAATDAIAVARSLVQRPFAAVPLRTLRPGARGAVWAVDDPVPCFLDLPLTANKLLARRRESKSRRCARNVAPRSARPPSLEIPRSLRAGSG
jgi:predicted ATP-grasp superfamily ATP-dependent carboligase